MRSSAAASYETRNIVGKIKKKGIAANLYIIFILFHFTGYTGLEL